MTLLDLFRFFRPASPELVQQRSDQRVPAGPPKRKLDAWIFEGRGTFPTQIHGESHYPEGISAALAGRKPWEEECVFRAVLVPEDNPHDRNAIAIYHVGGGQVGHLTRDCARRWRPAIDRFHTVSGLLPVCTATAGCGYEGGPVGIWLDIELKDIKREIERQILAKSDGVP